LKMNGKDAKGKCGCALHAGIAGSSE